MGRYLAWAGAIGLSPCPLAFRQTVGSFAEEKEVGVFGSDHSRADREALGFSSGQVLSLQAPVIAGELKSPPWVFVRCCVIGVNPVLDLPVPPAAPPLLSF